MRRHVVEVINAGHWREVRFWTHAGARRWWDRHEARYADCFVSCCGEYESCVFVSP